MGAWAQRTPAESNACLGITLGINGSTFRKTADDYPDGEPELSRTDGLDPARRTTLAT